MSQTDDQQSFLDEARGRAAALIASGKSGRATASEIGVSPSTISKWRRSQGFKAEVNRLLSIAREENRIALRGLTSLAIDAITLSLQPESPIAIRLENAWKLIQYVKLEPAALVPLTQQVERAQTCLEESRSFESEQLTEITEN